MEKMTTLVLNEKEARALTVGWGLVAAMLIDSPETDAVALRCLSRLTEDEHEGASTLTQKLGKIQEEQIQEMLARYSR